MRKSIKIVIIFIIILILLPKIAIAAFTVTDLIERYCGATDYIAVLRYVSHSGGVKSVTRKDNNTKDTQIICEYMVGQKSEFTFYIVPSAVKAKGIASHPMQVWLGIEASNDGFTLEERKILNYTYPENKQLFYKDSDKIFFKEGEKSVKEGVHTFHPIKVTISEKADKMYCLGASIDYFWAFVNDEWYGKYDEEMAGVLVQFVPFVDYLTPFTNNVKKWENASKPEDISALSDEERVCYATALIYYKKVDEINSLTAEEVGDIRNSYGKYLAGFNERGQEQILNFKDAEGNSVYTKAAEFYTLLAAKYTLYRK